jgi:hypothetical protein
MASLSSFGPEGWSRKAQPGRRTHVTANRPRGSATVAARPPRSIRGGQATVAMEADSGGLVVTLALALVAVAFAFLGGG